MKAICLQTYAPLRGQPSESSEMVSQLLFGEVVTIRETTAKWLYIINDYDGYCGWCDAKLLTFLSEIQEKELIGLEKSIVADKWIEVKQSINLSIQYILAGSVIYNVTGKHFSLLGNSYDIVQRINKIGNTGCIITDVANMLLNTPYLWGGRSSFGIDCSGLVQTCCRIAEVNLLRDASQQATQGIEVEGLENARQGDLVFFENEEGRVVHTGILLSKNEIIHASGCVRIDKIDEKGIFNKDIDQYTHKLKLIKRVI